LAGGDALRAAQRFGEGRHAIGHDGLAQIAEQRAEQDDRAGGKRGGDDPVPHLGGNLLDAHADDVGECPRRGTQTARYTGEGGFGAASRAVLFLANKTLREMRHGGGCAHATQLRLLTDLTCCLAIFEH
jgi:hypothetical protein